MLKTAGSIFAVVAVGTVAIAWTQTHKQTPQPAPLAETISPEKLMLSGGPLPEQQFKDLSFVFADDN
ncbi:MAG: hypothetical protein K2Z80_02640 [Xanthobacteraceae bacterium]|nr:hypothetical protein [Xanthobacteraceae bacterium]